MKLSSFALLLTITFLASDAFAQNNKRMGDMMGHANPMPNLMRVISQNASQLELTSEQSRALTDWRSKSRGPMHDLVSEIHDIENAIHKGSMDGKSKAELMNMATKLMQKRNEIITRKIDCRDNMRNILNDQQYAKVLAMYVK